MGRLLAADVLLAGLEGEDEAAAAVDVLGLAGDPARHAADVLLGRGEEAERGAAEVEPVAERLALADGDVVRRTRRAGVSTPSAIGSTAATASAPASLARRRERLDVLDRAEEVRVLDEDRGGLVVDCLGERGGVGEPVPRARPRPPRRRSRRA